MRGKRQMLPVPTAMPNMASIMAHREPKRVVVIQMISPPLARGNGCAEAFREQLGDWELEAATMSVPDPAA